MSNDEKQSTGSGGLFSSFLGEDATQRAWGFWESVKTNPKLQQAQQQAQQAWNSYDSEKVKQRLAELGKSATTYIDEADRRLETLELGAVNYIQQRGSEIVDKVKETAVGPEREGEVLYTGPDRTPVSRLDAEIMSLNASPTEILGAEASPATQAPAPAVRAEWLAKSTELDETFKSIVPAKLSEDEFWLRYASLRSALEKHDQRRKQLIHGQGASTEADDLDDWGSSDEEDTKLEGSEGSATKASAKAASPKLSESSEPENTEPKRAPKNAGFKQEASKHRKPKDGKKSTPESSSQEATGDAASEKRIEDEGSDSDWE